MAVADEVTAEMIAQVRRMVGEPNSSTYDHDTVVEYIAKHPLIDERGEKPYSFETSDEPPTEDLNEDWIPTFDLHATAAEMWGEKAATYAANFDFSVDGGNFTHSQQHEHCLTQARYHSSRRSMKTVNLIRETRSIPSEWIGNLAEVDD